MAMLFSFSLEALACSCVTGVGIPPSGPTLDQYLKERREYFLSKYNGAAFIGKIVKRERVQLSSIEPPNPVEPTPTEYYKYTIRVSKYWFGVETKMVIVSGPPTEHVWRGVKTYDSCSFKLDLGGPYFFAPRRYKKELEIDSCDFAGGASDPNGRPAAELRLVLGEPKRL